MKRIKLLSLVFIVLCILACLSVYYKQKTSAVDKQQNAIGIADTASITKVTIQSPVTKQVLVKTKGEWIVNGKYKTAFRPTALMLIAFNQLELKRPVSEEHKSKILNDLKTKGEKVTIDYEEGKKEWYFLTNENDINTTYFLEANSTQPYIAFVPGVSNNLNNLFLLSENDWRDKVLFSTIPRSMKSIKVNYPKDPSGDFEITYKEGQYKVEDVANLDSANFISYLPAYQYIPFTHYLTDKMDSVRTLQGKLKEVATIQVQDLDSAKSNSVKIFEDPANKREYIGFLGKTGEPVTLNRKVFDQLLVKKAYFIQR